MNSTTHPRISSVAAGRRVHRHGVPRIALGMVMLAVAHLTMAQAQGSPFMTGATSLQTNILRCSGSEHGGTSQFASRLIGEREVLRTSISRSRRATELLPSVTRAEHLSTEAAVMGAEIEQLPDLSGYLKVASRPHWLRVRLRPLARIGVTGRADEVGSPETNQKLSEDRAGNVIASLVHSGVPAERLELTALGNGKPLRAGSSDWDRASNRSVAPRRSDQVLVIVRSAITSTPLTRRLGRAS